MEQVDCQLNRESECYSLPTLIINPKVKSIFDFCYEDFEVKGYQHHPVIKAPIAV
jgi:thymidylate synthase